MSDERKKWLQKHVDYVFAECRGYVESKNNDCLNCLEGAETCYQVYEEIKRLIQQKDSLMSIEESLALVVSILEDYEEPKPEIDEQYVIDKACDASRFYKSQCKTVEDSRKFITQITREVQGKLVEVDEDFVEKWIDKLGIKVRQRWSDDYYVNPSRKDLRQMLIEAGVKIKK